MAISTNPLLKGMRGTINKQIVVKQFAHKTVVTKYPNMSGVVLSAKQKERNEVFAEAVKYAQSVLRNPEKYKEYRKSLKPGQRVYNQAIKAYLAYVHNNTIKPYNTEDEAFQYGGSSLSISKIKPIKAKNERKKGQFFFILKRYKPDSIRRKQVCTLESCFYHKILDYKITPNSRYLFPT